MNAAQLAILSTEILTTGHPDTGAYNANAQTAADEINALNRPNSNTVQAMFMYLFNKKHRTNQGTDTVYTPIIGRLLHVADSAVDADPFGRGAGNEVNLQQIHACKAMVTLLNSTHIDLLDYSDTDLPLGYLNGAGVISPSHKTALDELSNNLQSRATELGLPQVKASHITEVRGG